MNDMPKRLHASKYADELIQRYYDGDDSEATCIEALGEEIDRLEAKRDHLLEKVALQEKEIDRLTAELKALKENDNE